MRFISVVSTCAAMMMIGCHSSTAPLAFAGDYHLTAVNGAALPVSLSGIVVMRGSLHLGSDAEWILTRTQYAATNPAYTPTDTLSGHWGATGNDITLYFASTSVVQAVATYSTPAVEVVYVGNRYTFLPE